MVAKVVLTTYLLGVLVASSTGDSSRIGHGTKAPYVLAADARQFALQNDSFGFLFSKIDFSFESWFKVQHTLAEKKKGEAVYLAHTGRSVRRS